MPMAPTAVPAAGRGVAVPLPRREAPAVGGAGGACAPVMVAMSREKGEKKSGFGKKLFGEALKGLDQLADAAGVGKHYQKAKGAASEAATAMTSALASKMHVALQSHDDTQINRLLDEFLDLGTAHAPSIMLKAAGDTAAKQLNEAIASGEAKRLKGAIVATQRLQATHVPEYQVAVQKYAEVRRFPEGWIPRLEFKRQAGKFVTTSQLTDPNEIELIQQLLDVTHRKVVTRDRRGEPVPDRLKVQQVHRVENADQWVDYMAQQESIRRDLARHGGFQPHAVETMSIAAAVTNLGSQQALDPAVNEVWLFHGTNPIAAKSIAESNFRINLAGSHAGTLYGRGIYLAENSSKSDEYADPDEKGIRTMLLCRTTLGRAFYTDSMESQPRQCEIACLRGPYHSVLGDRRKARGTFREFVVYDQDQAYAEFVVSYSRHSG